MADETKDTSNKGADPAAPNEESDARKPDTTEQAAGAQEKAEEGGAPKPAAPPPATEKPAPPKASPPAAAQDNVQGAEEAGAAKPAPPSAGEKPAPPAGEKPAPPKAAPAAPAAGHKPAPPAKKGPVITVDITGDALIDQIRERFAEAITEAVATLGQQILRVKKESYVELCNYLHDNEDALFDMCTDLTAVHWPERSGQEFEVVILLYSVPKNRRLRVKVSLAEGEACPTVTPIWAGADWMEREVFDMFGIRFDGHPDLRRILLPEDWPGHPLRKEYPIEYRDNEWTDKHLDYREIDYDTSLIDVKYAERR
jgi:NADH-quinone oxidoreductase subunit C